MNRLIDIEFLKDRDACKGGIKYFEEEIKEPITARELIEKLLAADDGGKIWWANWLLVRLFGREQAIAYSVFAAEQVLPIFEQEYPDDKRPREVIEAAKKVALNDNGENRKIAADAANAANEAANAANAAAYAVNAAYVADYAAYAANAVAYAANAVAYAANAADAAYVAANATYAAANATYAANAANAAANATYAAYAADDAADAAAYAVDASDVAANAVAYTAGGKEMLLKIISFGIELLKIKK